jgi:preprotein translocase subunit SecD
MIGIAASMFSAIFVTRVVFGVLTDAYSFRLNFG